MANSTSSFSAYQLSFLSTTRPNRLANVSGQPHKNITCIMGRKKTSGFSFLFYNKDGDGLDWRAGSCLPTLMTWAVGQRTGMMARRPCFTISPFLFSLTLFLFFSRHLPLAAAERSQQPGIGHLFLGREHTCHRINHCCSFSPRECTVPSEWGATGSFFLRQRLTILFGFVSRLVGWGVASVQAERVMDGRATGLDGRTDGSAWVAEVDGWMDWGKGGGAGRRVTD